MKTTRLFLALSLVVMSLTLINGSLVLGQAQPQVQFAHLAPAVPAVDIYVDDNLAVSALNFQDVSAVIKAQSTKNAGQTPLAPWPREMTSIRPLSPYWVQTEATTAKNTEAKTTACATRCRIT